MWPIARTVMSTYWWVDRAHWQVEVVYQTEMLALSIASHGLLVKATVLNLPCISKSWITTNPVVNQYGGHRMKYTDITNEDRRIPNRA